MSFSALWAGAKLLIGDIFDGAANFVKEVVLAAVAEYSRSTTARPETRYAQPSVDELRERARELNEEEAEIAAKFERDRVRRQADSDRIEELLADRNKLRKQLDDAIAAASAGELKSRESELGVHEVDDAEIIANVGLIASKSCPRCKSVMRIHMGARNVQTGSVYFQWVCTGSTSCGRIPMNPYENRMTIARPEDADLDTNRKGLEAVWNDDKVLQQTHTRLVQHLDDEDAQVVCPTHLTPMKLLQKRDPGRRLLDSYEYACLNVGFDGKMCAYTVPMVKMPQVAAALKRKEGRGII